MVKVTFTNRDNQDFNSFELKNGDTLSLLNQVDKLTDGDYSYWLRFSSDTPDELLEWCDNAGYQVLKETEK